MNKFEKLVYTIEKYQIEEVIVCVRANNFSKGGATKRRIGYETAKVNR